MVCFPALRPDRLEEGRKIADGKESVTFDEHAHTGNNVGAEIVADRLKGIPSELGQEEEEFTMGFGVGFFIDPLDALTEGQVGPIGGAVVHVLGKEFVLEEIVEIARRGHGVSLLHAGEMGYFIALAIAFLVRHCLLCGARRLWVNDDVVQAWQ